MRTLEARSNRAGLAWAMLLLAGITMTTGCLSTAPRRTDAPAVNTELRAAEALYAQGRYTDAMLACIDLGRADPLLPGLAELQGRIVNALGERQREVARAGSEPSRRRMLADIESRLNIPGTYNLVRPITGESGSLKTPDTAMQLALDRDVTLHLEQVSLESFILAIGESENINMIADSMDVTNKTMTVHADRVPLSEILEFAARNLGVQFYVGKNVIWVTAADSSEGTTPMETRIYRLRKGLGSEEVEAGAEGINAITAIRRFVPVPEGADLLFDGKAHVLIAKNTRQNLTRIEAIVDALDVVPPQILIEARFISTSISDLRELGIDWVMNSPLTVSRKAVYENGRLTTAPRTQINSGAGIGFAPFANGASGMNLTYQGLLTDPLFQAVLHALETSGKARTLSVPKVTTVNNKAAKMRIGEDFRYFEEYEVQTVPTDVLQDGNTVYSSILVPVGTPQVEELGIELNVTPSVGADRRSVTLLMKPEISEFVRYELYEIAGSSARNNNRNNDDVTTNETSLVKLPIFRRSLIETEVIVGSGETVVMGGLISSTENKNRQGVPFLSAIPLIGRLFSHDNVDEIKQNLLVFVTATIISERGESLLPVTGGDQTSEAEAEPETGFVPLMPDDAAPADALDTP
jgi:type IV pilus assembly protein PilQ